MLFLPVRKTGADGMTFRPDEEIPEGVFWMQDDRADLSNDNEPAPFARLTPREIVLYGFLAGALGATVAALAGLVVAPAWPAMVTTLIGTGLASAAGWYVLGRRG